VVAVFLLLIMAVAGLIADGTLRASNNLMFDVEVALVL
jgi:hypothetical protein